MVDTMKIGATTYEVLPQTGFVLNDRGDALFGQQSYRSLEVRYTTDPPIQVQLKTLLHEAVHGMSDEYVWGIDETMAERIANGVYAFIRDNRELVTDILENG